MTGTAPTRVGLIGPGAIGCVVVSPLVGRTEIALVVGARTPFDRLDVSGTPEPTGGPAHVVTEPDDGPLDVVLLATKAHQTAGASSFLDAWVGSDTVLAVLQNGVDHVERTAPLVATEHIVPVVVACPASRSAPGQVHLGGRCQLVVPADADGSAIGELFADTFVEILPTEDWATSAWLKLLTNCCNGAIGALTRRDNTVFRDPEARALTLAMMREVAAVARAEGADIDDDRLPSFVEMVLDRAGDHMSSIVVDRINGAPTEWEVRNQIVVDLADRHGIDVPLVRATTTLLRLGEPEG